MKLNEYMQEGMQELAQEIQPNARMRARIMNEVQTSRVRTRPHRMRFVIAAAAAVCVMAGGAWAAGSIVGLRSGMTMEGDTQSFADQQKLEQKAGFQVRLPEQMGDASFQNMSVTPVDAIDANGKTVLTYQEFYVAYLDGDTRPFLSVIEQENKGDDSQLSDKTLVDTQEINGITVTYREIPTIFLPPDHSIQPTEQELEAQQRGECFISYGSDRRIDGVYHTASWQQDGLSYSIGCNDGDWTANDFFAAAQDVMETQP